MTWVVPCDFIKSRQSLSGYADKPERSAETDFRTNRTKGERERRAIARVRSGSEVQPPFPKTPTSLSFGRVFSYIPLFYEAFPHDTTAPDVPQNPDDTFAAENQAAGSFRFRARERNPQPVRRA